MLVLRAGQTRSGPAQRVSVVLARFRAEVLGVILNGCDDSEMDSYYGYGDSYTYGYLDAPRTPVERPGAPVPPPAPPPPTRNGRASAAGGRSAGARHGGTYDSGPGNTANPGPAGGAAVVGRELTFGRPDRMPASQPRPRWDFATVNPSWQVHLGGVMGR